MPSTNQRIGVILFNPVNINLASHSPINIIIGNNNGNEWAVNHPRLKDDFLIIHSSFNVVHFSNPLKSFQATEQ